jgi:hypothetical protein
MALISWIATTSGSWSVGSNWSVASGPLRGDDVVINTATPLTVTYDSATALFCNSITTTTATLSVAGGTLGVSNGYIFNGALDLSAGLLRLVGGGDGDNFNGNVTQSGGTLTLLNGAVAQGGTFSQTGGILTVGTASFTDRDGSSTLAGTIQGGGQMIFDSAGSTIALGSGFTMTVAEAEIQTGVVALAEKLTYGRAFTLADGGALALDGNTLTLSGVAALDSLITSGGEVNATGNGHLNGLILDSGVELSITGTYNQTGLITVGDTSSGTLVIGGPGKGGGALRLTTNSAILNDSGSGALMNYGLLAKVGGSSSTGTSTIYTAFTNESTGTLDVAVGTIAFEGPSSGFTSTLAGTIMGAGTVCFESGNYLISSANSLNLTVGRVLLEGSASMTLTTNAATNVDCTGSFDMIAGTLVVGSPGLSSTTLTLAGLTAFDGGLVKGTGTVLCAGTGAVNLGNGMDLEGNVTFNFQEAVSQTGIIYLGLEPDAITIADVAAGDHWYLEGTSSIDGFNGQINNQGIFGKYSGAGDSIVQSGLFSTGTLIVDTGMLTLSGVGSLGGSVTGSTSAGTSGVLDISGAYQFAAGLSLTVGEVILDEPTQGGEIQATLEGSLSYAGNWAQEGGTLALNGNTLTLNGITSIGTGSILGPGELEATGPAILGAGLSLEQGAMLQLNGRTEQTGNVLLTGGSTAPTLAIGPVGIYTMDAGTQLGGAGTSVVGTVVVSGTLVANGTGTNPSNVIAAALVDNGSIVLNYGEMQFLGPLTGHGSTTLSEGATLDLLGSGAVSNGITFGAGGGILSLGTQESYIGTITGFSTGDLIELQNVPYITTTNSLTVSGDTVTINENSGTSVTFTFSSAQSASQLILGEGPHGGAALIHL